jgi:hypothetical protein
MAFLNEIIAMTAKVLQQEIVNYENNERIDFRLGFHIEAIGVVNPFVFFYEIRLSHLRVRDARYCFVSHQKAEWCLRRCSMLSMLKFIRVEVSINMVIWDDGNKDSEGRQLSHQGRF